jgi:hypothetical protein
VRSFGQQVQGRQGAAGCVEEQGLLALLLGSRHRLRCHRNDDLDGLDAQWWQGTFLDLAPLRLDRHFTLLGDGPPVAAILPGIPQRPDSDIGTFE